MRVLIADDEPIQLRLLHRLATSWGHEVVVASDGIAAWRILATEGAPELALLDWMMTGMDGLDIVRRIRESEQACPPYLILLSARDSQEDVVRGLETGANDYIKKPINPGELQARIEVGKRVLQLRQSLAERVSQLQAEVCERQRAEAKNLRLLTAIEQASEGVAITDTKGTIEYVNEAFTRITGYTREEALGRNPRVLKSGKHDGSFYEELWKTIAAGKVWRGELINRRADGTLYTEEMSITPTRDSRGSIANFIAIKKDVTVQKAAEARVAREQELLRTLMDSVPDPIYFKDAASQFVRSNRAHATRLGLTHPDEAIGKTDRDFFSDEHASEAFEDERQIMATGNPLISKEERETWPDGRVAWVTSTKMPLRGPGGEIIGTFGISRDITQRKRAEDDLKKSEQRYRLQSLLMQAIYDVSPDGILVVDRNRTIVSHNRQFLEIWGFERTDLIGLNDDPVLAARAACVKDSEMYRRRVEALYADLAAEDHCEIELEDGRTLDRTSTAVRGANGEYFGRVWFFRDITDRKRAEETRALLASIVQSSEDAIFGTVDGIILSWNRGAELIFGYREEEVKNRPVSMLAPANRRDEVAQVLEKLMLGERVSALETVVQRKDGDRVDVSLTLSPIKNGGGKVVSAATIARDISARKRAEKARAEEERLVALRAEVGAALTGRGSLRAGLQECTEALVRWTGVAFARIWTLEPGATVLVLEASAGMYTHINGGHARVPVGSFKIGRIAQNRLPHLSNEVQGDPEVADHEWAKREGLVSFVGHPLLVRNEVVGVVAAFSQFPLNDAVMLALSSIANQIAQFIDARRAEDALQHSEQRARLLFSAIPHPAYVFDLDTLDFLEVNDRAVEQYGYSRDEFLAMKISDIRPAEEPERLREHLRSNPGEEKAGQRKDRTKDGRIIDVEITCHAIDYGGCAAALTIAQDITERKKLEVDLRHAQKLESVGLLASGIAHEINTPIQFVGDNLRFLTDAFGDLQSLLLKYHGLAESAAAGIVSPGVLTEIDEAVAAADLEYLGVEMPKALRQSLDGVARVATIVKAMKDFAHPAQNQKMPANLNEALASTLVVARNELKYVADVETDFADLPTVECHLSDLNQVFLNLLVNAAHAITEVVNGTGKKGTIRVQTRPDGDWVRIAISDTGCGIPEQIRGKVFDPFFTTKDVGRGTGQGLAISRSIVVEKHGGTLTFESEVGRGTTFLIGLPVSLPAE